MFAFRLWPALGLAALPLAARAQTGPAPADTARTPRYELGLTASPRLDHFFTANRSLPVGLLYRRQLRPGRAVRLRLVGFYSRRDTSITYPTFAAPLTTSTGPNVRTWEVNVFIGHEWQHILSRRWRWGYGIEAGAGYYRENTPFSTQRLFIDPVTNMPFVITSIGSFYLRRWQVQGRAFGSISYRVGSRLNLFAETAIVPTYSSQLRGGSFSTVASGNQGISPGNVAPDINDERFNIYLAPVQLLGIAAFF